MRPLDGHMPSHMRCYKLEKYTQNFEGYFMKSTFEQLQCMRSIYTFGRKWLKNGRNSICGPASSQIKQTFETMIIIAWHFIEFQSKERTKKCWKSLSHDEICRLKCGYNFFTNSPRMELAYTVWRSKEHGTRALSLATWIFSSALFAISVLSFGLACLCKCVPKARLPLINGGTVNFSPSFPFGIFFKFVLSKNGFRRQPLCNFSRGKPQISWLKIYTMRMLVKIEKLAETWRPKQRHRLASVALPPFLLGL